MRIEILGTGCPKCKTLEASARAAVESLGIEAEIAKVEEILEITARGVMMTPALVVDGEVKSVGKVLTKDEVAKLIG